MSPITAFTLRSVSIDFVLQLIKIVKIPVKWVVVSLTLELTIAKADS